MLYCSGRSLVDRDFQSLLGDIKRDSRGQIIGAAATDFKIIGHMNGTAAKLQTIKADSALGEYVSAFFLWKPWKLRLMVQKDNCIDCKMPDFLLSLL